MNTSTAKAQARTTVTAEARGERWTRDELELVATFTDDVTDEELALTLGRTLFALWSIQHRLRTEGVAGLLERDVRRDATPVTCPTHHITLTAFGTCDWC